MNKNSFAVTPPMGWNSYDYYDTNVTEERIKANADYMAEHLREYGWEYIVVDIQWYAYHTASMRDRFQYIPFSRLEIDEYGRLLPCPEKFPSSVNGAGFKSLADYVHGKGLKFGIHIMRGIPRIAAQEHMTVLGAEETADMIADPSSICGWNPDMYGVRNSADGQAYYNSIMKLYAEWGVDFIKCDDICNTNIYRENQYSARHEIEMLHRAIEECGREIVLSLSPGPALIDKAWHYEKYANMWRITDDFWDNWELLKAMFMRCELWQNHVKAGCFPDCDMLPLGRVGKEFGQERNTSFTGEEQRTMMTLWCIFRSPLMLGAELTMLDEWTLSLLTNRRVLSLLEDGHKAVQVMRDASQAVWMSRKKDRTYVALFNLSDEERLCKTTMKELESCINVDICPENAEELWMGESILVKDKLEAVIPAHGTKLYELKGNRTKKDTAEQLGLG